MYNHLLYFVYWILNSLIVYSFNLAYPDHVILGNWRFNPVESAIYAGFWVTFFVWVCWDFAIARGLKFDSAVVTFGYFWLSNAFSFWVVSRFSQFAGFGITSYVWALLIAVFAYILQRFAFRVVAGKNSM